jgi:hypothetical protein
VTWPSQTATMPGSTVEPSERSARIRTRWGRRRGASATRRRRPTKGYRAAVTVGPLSLTKPGYLGKAPSHGPAREEDIKFPTTLRSWLPLVQ